MTAKKLFVFIMVFALLASFCACGVEGVPVTATDASGNAVSTVSLTDMIGREVMVAPGTYQRVVCVGAGALRMYSYIGDVSALVGVEDIDNTTLAERPMMFDSVARPYVLAFGDTFNTLPSCGVGGPMAQAAEAEKILSCDPDIVISMFEDVDKANALQEQLGVPVITLSAGANGVFDEKFAGSMELLGKIFAREEKAADLVQFVEAERAAIEAIVVDVAEEDKPSVYICGLGNWGTTDHLMTAENYISFQIAGVKNAVSGLGIQGIGPIEEENRQKILTGNELLFIRIQKGRISEQYPQGSKEHHIHQHTGDDNDLAQSAADGREVCAFLSYIAVLPLVAAAYAYVHARRMGTPALQYVYPFHLRKFA